MTGFWLPFVVLLASPTVAVLADAPPEIPASSLPTVTCVYHALQSRLGAEAVNVYVIDRFRSAVEYSFQDKTGRAVVADVLLSYSSNDKVTYSGQLAQDQPKDIWGEAADFLGSLNLTSRCGSDPVFDNLYPDRKPRAEWRRVDLPSQ